MKLICMFFYFDSSKMFYFVPQSLPTLRMCFADSVRTCEQRSCSIASTKSETLRNKTVIFGVVYSIYGVVYAKFGVT
jgi:hypothetical protein